MKLNVPSSDEFEFPTIFLFANLSLGEIGVLAILLAAQEIECTDPLGRWMYSSDEDEAEEFGQTLGALVKKGLVTMEGTAQEMTLKVTDEKLRELAEQMGGGD